MSTDLKQQLQNRREEAKKKIVALHREILILHGEMRACEALLMEEDVIIAEKKEPNHGIETQ